MEFKYWCTKVNKLYALYIHKLKHMYMYLFAHTLVRVLIVQFPCLFLIHLTCISSHYTTIAAMHRYMRWQLMVVIYRRHIARQQSVHYRVVTYIRPRTDTHLYINREQYKYLHSYIYIHMFVCTWVRFLSARYNL